MVENVYSEGLKSAPFGYAVHRLLTDDTGRVTDYEVLEINRKYETLCGLSGRITGNRIETLFPAENEAFSGWRTLYQRIRENPENEVFEHVFAENGQSVQVNTWITDMGYLACTLTDSPVNGTSGRTEFFPGVQQHIFWNNNLFGIIIADKQGNYVDANEEAARMTGYTCAELKEMNMMQLVDPAWVETAKMHFGKIHTTGKAYGEVPYFTKNGERRWWNVVASRLSDEYMIGFHEDITDRRKSEAALQQAQENLAEREAQYRLIAENSKDLIYVYHLFPEPGYDYISPSCYTLTGYMPEEGYADPFAYHKFINTAEGVERFTRFLLDPAQPAVFEEEWRKKDGVLIWVEQVVCRNFDEKGNLVSFQSTVRDITERKKSKAVFQDIIDKNPISIQILDLEGYTLQTNLAHTNLFGIKPPANYSMFRDEQLLKRGFGTYFEAIQQGETVFFPDTHYNIKHVDPAFPDKPVWIKAVGFPLTDTRGNPEYYVLMHENITERKKAEDELQVRERRFSQLIQNSYDTIVIMDSDGIQRYVSPSAEKVHGYSPAELVNIPVMDLMIHPDDQANVKATFQAIIDTGSGSVEYRHRHKSGGWVYLEAIGSNQLENPDITGVVVNVRDVTQRKLAEERLMASNRKFRELSTLLRLMTDNMPDMLWAKNLNKEFIFTNKAICDNLLGAVDTEEPLGKNDMFFATRQRAMQPENPHWHTFGEICSDSDSITLEEMKPTQFNEFGNVNGKFLFLDVHKAPLFDDQGQLIGVVGSARDITERKALEEELSHQTRLRELLMEISAGFINIPLDKVEDSINEALRKMGQFVQADRSYTFDYDWEKAVCNNTYEWCNEGVKEEIQNLQNLPLSIMMDTVSEHKKGKTVYIPDVEIMPPGVAKDFVRAQGVISFIMVPMMNQHECIGFVGFDSVRGQKEYFSSDVQLLEVFAQLLANVKLRQSMVKELVAAKLSAEESEEKHRTLIEQMLEGLLVDDEQGIIQMVNPMFCKMTGYSADELLGISGYELMLKPEDVVRMKARDIERKQNIPEQYELDVITKWGEVRTFWFHATPIIGKTGRYIASMSTVTDITGRKQDQERIRITRDTYESILNSVSEAIYVLDENGIFIDVNRGAEIMYGYAREELIGMSPSDVSAPDRNDLEAVGRIIGEVAQSGIPRSFEFWGLRKNGEAFPKDVSINRGKYFGKDHIIATARDITERKKTETARRIQYTIARSIHTVKTTGELLEIIRNELRQLFDTTNFFVARYIPERDSLKPLVFFDENDSFEEWDAATSLSGQVVKTAKALFLRGPEVDAYSHEHQLPVLGSDTACWLGVPITINHKVSAVMVIQHYADPDAYSLADVALLEMVAHETGLFLERQQMIEDLIRARDRAEESDRLKSAFLANMSHEIRTPMNGILGFVELLHEPDLTGEELQKYIAIITKSGQRMLNIINDIVDISKIEAGLMEIHLSESNINEQIEYIHTFFKPEAMAKGLSFSVTDLLPRQEANWQTDREKLYAILTNLVKNAIKYTHKGAIGMGCVRKGDFLEFYVKDSGIGIPADRQQAVFERFIQADIEDRMAYQGAGLGLTISKNYAEMLGGNMWLESLEGSGTTVYFTLPCSTAAAVGNTSEAAGFAESLVIDRKLKILIVDDDETSELLLRKYLEKLSPDIRVARTGPEALSFCHEHPDIALVLMDIRIPGFDGYEATRQIRKFNSDVVIIAQTAYGLTGDREMALESGCDEYLPKPISKENLYGLLGKFFDLE